MKLNRKSLIIGGASIIVVAAVGFLAYRHYHKASTPPATTSTGVNLSPATPGEKSESENNKDQIVQDKNSQQNSTTTPTSGKKPVSVVITSASASNVSAYASGVLENGGICTATFTQGSTTITRTSQGFVNVSYTQCAPITPNLPNNSGWSVVVSYSSSAAQGQSDANNF